MALKGKGFFIWKVKDCEGGNPHEITRVSQEAGFSHVLVKIADGAYPYNVDRDTNTDLAKPVVNALKAAGIEVWGWHYVYGDYPIQEANIAVDRLRELDLHGYVIDAEMEYKEPGKETAARQYMNQLRRTLPDLPMALSSYRFPSYHPQLPWKTFLEKCDYNMPQVYWEQAHNPDPQLRRTVREFQALSPFRPVIPTGPTYRAGSWVPKPDDLKEFMDTAKQLNLTAVNFFSWDECRPAYPDLWNAVADYDWEDEPAPPDITEKWIAAMNSNDPLAISQLYHTLAVHITSARTIQGLNAIQAWYQTMTSQLLPGGRYTLTGSSGIGSSRHFTWTCKANGYEVLNGNDTLGLLNGKIAYHYTYFTVKSL